MTSALSLVFLGSKRAGLRLCTSLAGLLPPSILKAIICPDDSADARSMQPQFRELAARYAIPFHVVANQRETIDLLGRYTPDTALVHGWYQIIPVGECPQTNFFGFHYAPLPRYRGNAPLVWQIIRGETRLGVSFFQLTEEMDAGGLIGQRLFDLGESETIADALEKADALADNMLRAFLPGWLRGEVRLTDQSNEEPSYCGLRIHDDGRIDWSWSASRLHDFVRAQSQPYPGAFSDLPDGRRLRIWRTLIEPRRFFGVPGAVAEIGSDHVVVTAGDGAIRLLRVQLDDGEEANAAQVLRSLRLRLR